MSLVALLVAARDRIRSELGIDGRECGIEIGPRPPQLFGRRYCTVYGAGWTPDPAGELMHGIMEVYAIGCTWTFMVEAPDDRIPEEGYIKEVTSIEAYSRKVIVALHQNWDIINAANTVIGTHKIIEPLRWLGTDAVPTLRDAEWINSPAKHTAALRPITMETRFGGAMRSQTLTSLE